MSSPPSGRPAALIVLDGWGWREEQADNAVALAETPVFNRLWEACPHAFLAASGEAVGLPAGQIGNSEVGHLNIGAGRVVLQELPRISRALAAGEHEGIPVFRRMVEALKRSGGTCHLIALISEGGVHSHQDHVLALARSLDRAGVPVALHVLTDGRDVAPKAAPDQVGRFLAGLEGLAQVRVATLGGRYFAMDRDHRWDRIEKAWRVMVEASGPHASDPLAAIGAAHAEGIGDEFIPPVVIEGYGGMKDGDALLCANFRADRVRQILTALLAEAFDGFERGRRPAFAAAVGMAEYSVTLDRLMETLFPPEPLGAVLGEVVAEAGLTQLRAAETEKYPHVTFFLNGGREEPWPGEARILVPSPKVATYDLKPEMSAPELTESVEAEIAANNFGLIVLNFANPDMVGHTGDLKAAIRAVETVDRCLGRIIGAVAARGGALLVTADHGNCEQMRDPDTGGPHTAHTLNPVPLLLVNAPADMGLADGVLADLAPSLLDLLGLPQPAAMTGRSLIRRRSGLAAPA